MIRVVVAAASAVVHSGLEVVVRSSELLELAGSLWAGEPGDEDGADAALLAMAAPDDEWLRTAGELACPAVLLTDEPGLHLVSGSIRGVLSLNARPEQITAALLAVAEGLCIIPAQGFERRPAPLGELEEPLTQRETEVLRMLAEGLSNKLIAHRLAISEHTVKFHVTQVMAKLRASSRTDAAMQGIRRGLVLL